MSEQASSPEQRKPLHDNCNSCSEDYDLTPETAELHLHKVNPDCDHLLMRCPHCGTKTALFGINEDTIQRAVDSGIDPEYHKYPNDSLLNLRLGYLGIELVQPVALTPRHEKLISQFEEVLTTTPDEHLYELIVDDGYNRPYPQRWS
jgi:hypothetical protein